MKLIFAVLDVSLTMGLTRCYKTEGFFTFIIIYQQCYCVLQIIVFVKERMAKTNMQDHEIVVLVIPHFVH